MIQLVEQETLTEDGILLIAKFLWYLPILCPTLKQCLLSVYQQVRNFVMILIFISIIINLKRDIFKILITTFIYYNLNIDIKKVILYL